MKRLLPLLAALALIVMLTVHSGSPAGAASRISIAHTPAAGDTNCLPAWLAASATITDTATAWTVRIDAHAPICDEVTAAIYAMPDNPSNPWPQHLVEKKSFTITPGITVVTF